MAFYDSATYDSGIFYDQAVPAARPKKMQIKLNLQGKNDAELKQYAQDHITKMTGNAAFPAPVPTTPEFQIVFDAFDTALGNANAAAAAALQATAAKKVARLALEEALTQRANNIAGKPGVTEADVLSTGFSTKAPRTPSGPPPQVLNLSLTAGDNSGELDVQWDPNGANSYEVQSSPEPMTPTSWTKKVSVTKSKTTLTGYTSGTQIWVRVRAITPGGEGPWSDPATKFVP